jgi:hypothetical protein
VPLCLLLLQLQPLPLAQHLDDLKVRCGVVRCGGAVCGVRLWWHKWCGDDKEAVR